MPLHRLFLFLLVASAAAWGWSYWDEQRLKQEAEAYRTREVAPAMETANREVAAVKEALRRRDQGETVSVPALPIAATQAQVTHGKIWLELSERHARAIQRTKHLGAAFGFILLAWGATGRLRREWHERGKPAADAIKENPDSNDATPGGT